MEMTSQWQNDITSWLLTLGCLALQNTALFKTVETPLGVILVLFLGIPHGAADHLVFYSLLQSPHVQATFYLNYLAIGCLWGIAWALVPTLTLWSFLIVSAYHFGETDMHSCTLNPELKSTLHIYTLHFSRGVYLVGMMLSHDPKVSFDIIGWMIPSISFSSFTRLCSFILPLVISQHFLILTSYLTLFKNQRIQSQIGYEILKATMYWTLFERMGTMTAFSIFFGLWHSLTSVSQELVFFKRVPTLVKRLKGSISINTSKVSWNVAQNSPVTSIQQFYLSAMPSTLISFLGMGLLALFYRNNVFGSQSRLSESDLWSIFIVSISILTGPHMWIMSLLHHPSDRLDPLFVSSLFERTERNPSPEK